MNQTFEILKQRAITLLQIEEATYKIRHPYPLQPLDIKIDCEQFTNDITKYEFKRWGDRYLDLPRYGIPLVNENGKMDNDIEPTVGSLSHWNEDHPTAPHMETDFTVPTQAMYMKSLLPLSLFKDYWTRSNILKWESGAEFKPHIDTMFPALWYRFWGTTDPSTIELGFANGDSYDIISNIEAGRIYLIDTSIVHIARASGLNYQFFLSVRPDAWNLIETHLVAAK